MSYFDENTEREGIVLGKKKFKYNLIFGISVAALAGLVCGIVFGEKMASFKIMGDLFLRMMQMPIILLIMSAVIEAVGTLNPKELGRLGMKTLVLFGITTAVAGLLGLTIAYVIQPGVGLQVEGVFDLGPVSIPEPANFSEQLLGYVSNNIFASMASGNNLQCVIIAILFGITLSLYGAQNERNPVLEGIKSVNKVVMQFIFIVIQALPIAIFSFISYAVGVIGPQVLRTLAKLIFANFIGTSIMMVLYILIACAYCKVNPFLFFPKIGRMTLIALVSTSSAVTLPAKMEDGEKKIGISPRVNRLVAPMGMSMNSDGAVLFFCLSCVTIAQVFGIHMELSQLVTLVLFSTAFSFAAVSVPGGGLVMLVVVLAAVGLPAEGMVIISAADFFLAPIRTVGNSIDDVMIAMIVAQSEGEFDRDIYNGKKEFDPNVFSYKKS
jgi:Na+/H+-dicarboxylate symporter